MTCRVIKLILVHILIVFNLFAQDYPYSPVRFSDVLINDSFWSGRMETNRKTTIPYAFKKCELTGRISNFAEAGKVNEGITQTARFCSKYGYDDSDVYKIIEGASYSLSGYYDASLDQYLDSIIRLIAGAQENDGYLYSMRTVNPSLSWAPERWVNARNHGSHELYNVGHLYEAAVAHHGATGKKTLLDVALKNADLLCSTFGPGKRRIASGHQEIEIGLAKLYRVTRERKYLELARFLLDERGRGDEHGSEYTQDHRPVVDKDEAIGHAVRANYMYSAMADVAALLNDKEYIRAIDRIWENVAGRKLYITGGVGATSRGEAYGRNYELPNLSAYNETCAAIANVFWNHRMFLLHGESKYIDVLERTLYNGLISGVSLDGKTFFYPNPLESEGKYERSEWFDCSCCPSNICRFVPSLPGYIYATKDDSLFVNLFIGNNGNIRMKEQMIDIRLQTAYPWQEKVLLKVNPESMCSFALCIRIPAWLGEMPLPGGLYRYANQPDEYENIKITLNGEVVFFTIQKGYAVIDRNWKRGDQVEIFLPMPVRLVKTSDQVTDNRDRVSISRGPVVFCAEGIDNSGNVLDYIVPENSKFDYQYIDDSLGGIPFLASVVQKVNEGENAAWGWTVKSTLRLIPYYAWCHRGAGMMNVWFYSKTELRPASDAFKRKPGLEYFYLKKKLRNIPDFSAESIDRSGFVSKLDINSIKDTNDAFCIHFRGLINIPEDGMYTFFLKSDDGARMYIDHQLMIDNDGVHGMTDKKAQAALGKGLHPFRLEYFEYEKEEGLELEWIRPGFTRENIPEHAWFH